MTARMKTWMRWAAVSFVVSGIAFICIGIADGIVVAIVLGIAMLAIAWAQCWQIRHARPL
jgi:MFS superfamily sulfate permease-like transporter